MPNALTIALLLLLAFTLYALYDTLKHFHAKETK